MSRIKGIPDTSGEIIWINQFKRKAESYKAKIDIVLGDNWEHLNEGRNVKEVIENIIKKTSIASKIGEEWRKKMLSKDSKSYTSEKI